MITVGDFNLIQSKVKKYSFETVTQANECKLSILDSTLLVASRIIQLNSVRGTLPVEAIKQTSIGGIEVPEAKESVEVIEDTPEVTAVKQEIEALEKGIKVSVARMILNLAGLCNYLSVKMKVENTVSIIDTNDICKNCFKFSKDILNLETFDYLSDIKQNTEYVTRIFKDFTFFLTENGIDISVEDITCHLN